MNYYEFVFTYSSPIPASILHDILAEELGQIGFESFIQSEEALQAYLPAPAYNEVLLKDKLAAFPLDNVGIKYAKSLIEGKDWNAEWEKNYFKPIEIGDQCLIRASFHQPEEGFRHTIVIDPKMAFGTGNHETTYLMIMEMLKLDLEGAELLDMGCGTAVLAILAKMKGAKRVVAIDNDEWAYQNALENIRLNHTDDIKVLLGDAGLIGLQGTFDYIFANINRNILLNDLPFYSKALKPKSFLYMSGFYTEDISALEKKAEESGLKTAASVERNHWCAIKLQKQTT